MKNVFNTFKAALVVAAFAVTAHADTSVNLGFKGGLSVNYLRVDAGAVSASANETHWGLGGFADFGLQDYVNIVAEAQYLHFADGFETIQVPVLYRLKFKTNSGFRPYVQAGPELGIKIKDDTSAIKTVNFGIQTGGGCEYWFTQKIALLLEARYTYGLTEIRQNATAGASLKVSSLQLLTGMSFAL